MAELQQRTERRSEMSRGRRAPGPPRHPAGPGPVVAMRGDPGAVTPQDQDTGETEAQPDRRELVRLEPGEPVNTMALRIRRTLDRWLTDAAYEINSTGWRTSKAELLEMMIWEEFGASPLELKGRLTEFRRLAPRR